MNISNFEYNDGESQKRHKKAYADRPDLAMVSEDLTLPALDELISQAIHQKNIPRYSV